MVVLVFAEDALKCAKTCRICCERPKYDCEDKESSTFCDTHKNKCVSLKAIIVDKCPHTCGLCDLTGVTTCKDKNIICKELKDSCNDANPITKDAVRKLCPKTCDACPGTGATTGTVPRRADCKDEASNCDSQKDLCENTFYKSIMETDCKLSCVYCLPTNYVCEDKNSADCARWDANGFCSNTAYSRQMRLQHCGKYCKMCS
uniref:ShKT domain-containing protein n=1 Tax=Ditylenchus dipsaci TaxID=166011 RepID=A0A915ERE6_9BILA